MNRSNHQQTKTPISIKRIAIVISSVLIIGTGLLVRLDDLQGWYEDSAYCFFNEEPLLATGDGYFYLSLAQDLVDNTYHPMDERRVVPDVVPRPSPPPLLSVLTALLAKHTPLSLNWVAVLLPAILGILLAVPIYAFGHFFGGHTMALTASAIALTSNGYISRTCLGKYDTDCLNVTFTLAIAYCAMRFGLEKDLRRYYFLGASFLLYGLFLWWWNQALVVVSVITFAPLLLAILFYYRPAHMNERRVFFLSGFLFIVASLTWQGAGLLTDSVAKIVNIFHYLSDTTSHEFPQVGEMINEQTPLSAHKIIGSTAGNSFFFTIAFFGWIPFVVKERGKSLFLAIPFILAIFSYFFAKRFIIFTAPVLAIGTGYLASLLFKLPQIRRVAVLLVLVFVFAFAWINYKVGGYYHPIWPPDIIEGMAQVKEVTPKNAIIWNWHDDGYPLIYWSRRATIIDGQSHSNERTVYNAIPLAMADERLAANFINFFSQRGQKGIDELTQLMTDDKGAALRLLKQAMASGPEGLLDLLQNHSIASLKNSEDWEKFFFPHQTRPTYLFLNWTIVLKGTWVLRFGTWDISKRQSKPFAYEGKRIFDNIHHGDSPHKLINNSGSVVADLNAGSMTFQKGVIALTSAAITTEERHNSLSYFKLGSAETKSPAEEKKEYHLEAHLPSGYASLQSKEEAEAVFNRLFWRPPETVSNYFSPVDLKTPHFRIWQVHPDQVQQRAHAPTPDQ